MPKLQGQALELTVENIGGIREGTLALDPGISILAGENATNRTSMLQAIGLALGGSHGFVKSDEDRGQVTLRIDGQEYTRELQETNGSTQVVGGEPLVADPELIDNYVCLLENNPGRVAIRRGENLRDFLMAPVDVDEIQSEIRRLQTRRQDLADEINQIERDREQLPDLRRRRDSLEEELESVTTEIQELQNEIDAHEHEAEAAKETEELVEKLEAKRESLQACRQEIEETEQLIDSLKTSRSELEAELNEIEEPDDEELGHVDTQLSSLYDQQSDLENFINDLLSVIEFNQQFVGTNGDDGGVAGVMQTEQMAGEESPTAALTADGDTIHCWTCGTEVRQEAIESRVEELREQVQEYRSRRREVESDIEELQQRKQSLESQQEEVDQLHRELEETNHALEEAQEEITALRSQRDDLQAEIDDLESDLEQKEEFRDSELLDLYEDLSDAGYEQGRIETELEEVRTEIERLEELADRRETLESDREEIADELETLREQVATTERELIETFNARMEEVLDRLEFSNVTRVWLERKTASRESEPNEFVLHVVRETDDGSVYEERVDHLSESEREVIGIMVAVVGNTVHSVGQDVPMILLDSVEAIDAERLSALLEYLNEDLEYVVAALLPEDAAQAPDQSDVIEAGSF